MAEPTYLLSGEERWFYYSNNSPACIKYGHTESGNFAVLAEFRRDERTHALSRRFMLNAARTVGGELSRRTARREMKTKP